METLQIIIKGVNGAGKTAMANAIRSLCEQRGVEVKLHGCEDETRIGAEWSKANWSPSLNSLRGRVQVDVETVRSHGEQREFIGGAKV